MSTVGTSRVEVATRVSQLASEVPAVPLDPPMSTMPPLPVPPVALELPPVADEPPAPIAPTPLPPVADEPPSPVSVPAFFAPPLALQPAIGVKIRGTAAKKVRSLVISYLPLAEKSVDTEA